MFGVAGAGIPAVGVVATTAAFDLGGAGGYSLSNVI